MPAPTLRLRPGDVLTLHIQNELPAAPTKCKRAMLATPEVGNGDAECENTFHNVNDLNIHTHGLHVSPLYDNVFVRHPPGTFWRYVIPIRGNHAAGTFWWHPHVHGAGCAQVASLAAGVIVIEDDPARRVYAEEKVLMLQEWRFSGLASLPSLLKASFASDYPLVAQQLSHTCGFDPATFDPSSWHVQLDPKCSFTVVNNALRPTTRVRAGTWTRLRFVAGTWSGALALAVTGPSCEAYLLALDGNPLQPRPLPLSQAQLSSGGLVLGPGQRADVALRCRPPAPGEEPPALVAMPKVNGDDVFGAWFQLYLPNDVNTAPVVLMDISVSPSDGGSTGDAPPLALPPGAMSYLGSLLQAEVTQRHSWAFDSALFCERMNASSCNNLPRPLPSGLLARAAAQHAAHPQKQLTGFSTKGLDDITSIFYINGDLYRGEGAPALHARVGDVHEWTLTAGWVTAHVMHLHAVPFQIVSYDKPGEHGGGGAGAYLRGRWVDSVIVPAGGSVTIRLRFADHGPTLLHCHTLLHQDIGMAAVVDVQSATQ